MTKFNKVGKSTFVIAVLSFLLVAVLAFGGTYAYFSATATPVTGSITMGALYIDLKDTTGSLATLGEFKNVNPNQEIVNKTYTVDLTKDSNASTIPAFIRVKVTAVLDGTKYTPKADGTYDNNQADSSVNSTNLFSIKTDGTWYQYTEGADADGYTYYVGPSGTKDKVVAVGGASAGSVALPIKITINKEVGKNGSTFFMGATGTYTIIVEAIQATYLKNSAVVDNDYSVAELSTAWAKIKGNTAAPYAPVA